MPHTDVIPTSASIASTGFGIRYIGEYCYAYSGEQIIGNAIVTMLEFVSGSGLIFAKLYQTANYYSIDSGQAAGFYIYLNDLLIIRNYERIRVGGDYENMAPQSIEFIIPPFTKVKTQAQTDDTSNNSFFQTLTGRVYGAV